MEEAWLRSRLESGRSIESIAREVGNAPSTVAYWVTKHGLVSAHTGRHAPRGGIEREQLDTLVEAGLTVEQMASELRPGPRNRSLLAQALRPRDCARSLADARAGR